ncbi:DUF6585 family protein [Streptomyces sp. RKAG337]|uniref:DUF6585 family protein n=1 Tax=Streptomyces sp. RKAG337 TaxID=2893404 RepID=UPI00203344E2|nr:DUF6585 family protein [Streptomyces sp. RKAG337]MCM2430636.1 hypothetical protein [Streptomyces sp. RKAG337]
MATANTLPPEARELAEHHHLGALQGAFTPKPIGKGLVALHLFATVNLLAMFVIPGLLYYWLRRLPNFNRTQAAKRLYLFEHGLIVHPQFGDGVIALRWESVRLYQNIIQTIINGVPGPTTYTYSAVGPGRTSATITEFYDGPRTWGPWMQDAVVRAQGQAALEAVLEGGTVNFGSFTLSRAGVSTHAKGQLPWSHVQECRVTAGRVHVMRTGASSPWSSDAVGSVANLHLFLALAANLAAE